MTGTGSKTRSTLLNELHALVDESKLTFNSKFQYLNNLYEAQTLNLNAHEYTYVCVNRNASDYSIASVTLKSSGSVMCNTVIADDGTITHYDNSSSNLPSGYTFDIKY